MKEKYERMMNFAERLCLKGYPEITEARKAKLWQEAKGFLERCIESGATGFEENPADPHGLPCDTYHEYFREYDITDAEYDRYEKGKSRKERNRFDSMLSAVCRAALDTLNGSAGVFGWTIGTIREMYDGEIPEWFADQFLEPEKVREANDEARIML